MNLSRPVFILAPPRSGSTLLFETLAHSSSLYSLGDEGHGIIEQHRALTPQPFSEQSNRLTGADLTEALAEQIRADFIGNITDSDGRGPTPAANQLRLLEKTPKNILRIPFLLALFPDAMFIYLYRDPRENISSIIDGWRSGRFRTYRDKETPHGLWSFLLPPDWAAYRNKSLGEIAAFQWCASHRNALQDLADIGADRWRAINFQTFLDNPESAVRGLCDFIGVPMDDCLREHCCAELPRSRYTLTPPAAGKWQRNAVDMAPHMQAVEAVAEAINEFTAGDSLPLETDLAIETQHRPQGPRTGRNEPCSCGSGKRYKHCHGRI
ncbi:MAG: sulfotransferase [Halioglobus sp.]